MARHVKSFTYKPKIEAVRNGTCRQTIRPIGKKPINVGDTITFHGWEGRPYHSDWSWRMEVEVTKVFELRLNGDCFFTSGGMISQYASDDLARRDGIEPPTREALHKVLKKFYGKKLYGMIFNVIRWKPIAEKSKDKKPKYDLDGNPIITGVKE